MAYNLRTARALCTATELDLVEASFPTLAGSPTKARLRAKLVRVRRLRDKYRDLWRRQRLANRERTGTKFGARPGSNARTEEKARLFEEALGRLQAQMDKLVAAEHRAAAVQATKAARARRAAPGSPPGKARAKPSPIPRAGFVSEAARRANLRQRAQKTRAHTLRAHVRAQGRRNQARRDSRSR